MYEVQDRDTTTSEILPHLSVAKRGYVSKSESSEVIQCGLHKRKTACQWPITSAFPMMLFSLSVSGMPCNRLR